MSVSVIITCYNLERFLGAAIDSARAALAATGGEIVVVDDCSTDRSVEIVRRYPDVRLVEQEVNGGVMLAMLAGFAAARFDLVALLDGDDLWRPDKLAKVVAEFERTGAAMVTHDLRYVDCDGYPTGRPTRPSEAMAKVAAHARSAHLLRSILEHRDDIWLGSAMTMHRERADLAGFARFVEARGDRRDMYQDWPLAAWVATRPGAIIGYVPEPLFDYRLHLANHSGDARALAHARRNFARTRNTMRAMIDIARPAGALTAKLRAAAALAEGQVALYDGRRVDALRWGWGAMPRLFARPRELAKEAVRALALGVLGPERGHRMLKGDDVA